VRLLVTAAVAAAALAVPTAAPATAQGVVYGEVVFVVTGSASVPLGVIPPTGVRQWTFTGTATVTPVAATTSCSITGYSVEDVATGTGSGFGGTCAGRAIWGCLYARAGLTVQIACPTSTAFEATLQLQPANVNPSTAFTFVGAGSTAYVAAL